VAVREGGADGELAVTAGSACDEDVHGFFVLLVGCADGVVCRFGVSETKRRTVAKETSRV
jgi:hypothetical protein